MAGIEEETDVSKLRISNDEVEKTVQRKGKRSKRRRSSSAKVHDNSTPKVEVLKKEKKRKSFLPPSFELSKVESRFNGLRDLALYLLGLNQVCPTFTKVNNRHLIQHVVLLIIPGLELTDFGIDDSENIEDQSLTKCPEELPFIKQHFENFLLTTAPGDKQSLYPLIKALSSIPYTKKQRNMKIKELEKTNLILPDLLMTFQEFHENDYPIHPLVANIPSEYITDTPEGWVDTVKFEHEGSHTFAVDCEMCNTASGKVLTRISLIDFNEEVVMDEFVKPDEAIVDYVTQYSGITEEILRNVTTSLKDIQEKLLTLVSSDDILIGHSIENDLEVLKLRHPKIVDTSLIFEHPRGLPFKSSLKYLANQYLKKTIQEGSHDSVEDAKACLDLVKLKLVNNALLGKVVDGESLFKVMSDAEKKCVILDYLRVQNNQDRYVQCFNDDEITDNIVNKVKNTELVVAKFKEIETTLGWDEIYSKEEEEDAAGEKKENDSVSSAPDKSAVLKTLNRRLEKIYQSLPGNTALFVTSGYSDPRKVKSLGMQKKNFKRDYQNKVYSEIESNWTTEDETSLKQSLKLARRGISFMTIKQGDSLVPDNNTAVPIDEVAIIEEETTTEDK